MALPNSGDSRAFHVKVGKNRQRTKRKTKLGILHEMVKDREGWCAAVHVVMLGEAH